jgi:tripeptide aminopeptidase
MANPSKPPEPNLKEARRRVMRLMAIEGASGNEAAIAEAVVAELVAAGAERSAIRFDAAHKKTILRGQIGNLIFKLPGTMKAPRRLLAAHLDTVPICVGSRPKREGDIVRSAAAGRGLGADNRAGTAAILTAAVEILRRRLPHPPLTFLWTVQEEVGLQGARHVNVAALGKPALAFNWDGGAAGKVTVGATGGYRMEITITGLASHAGVAPEKGVSAIAIASLAIADLCRGGWHGAIDKPEGKGTSNIGVIAGGEATNVVAEKTAIRAEARSHDPTFRQKIVAQIQAAFERAAGDVRSDAGAAGSVDFQGRLDYESFLLPKDEPCVQSAEAALHSIGLDPFQAVASGGLDANWLTAHGIPTVTLGCGQQRQHTAQEALDLNEFDNACRAALVLATASEDAAGE